MPEVAACADPLEVPVLRVAQSGLADRSQPARPEQQLLERSLDLPVDDGRPVVVVGREDAARAEDPRRLGERRLRLHPVEGLRAGDDVGHAVGQARLLGVRLDEADVLRGGRGFRLGAHLRARLDAHDLVCAIGPGARGEAGSAAEVDDERAAAPLVPRRTRRRAGPPAGTDGASRSPAAKPSAAYPEPAQQPLGVVLDQLVRVLVSTTAKLSLE